MAVVIVGASVAGLRTAQALRMAGYHGDIVLIGEEPHQPYDKPPLSKESLLDGSPVPLLSEEQLAELRVELRLGVRATALDPKARAVSTSDGRSVSYSTLVIATGVKPRTLTSEPAVAGVHVIRTADDAQQLSHAMKRHPHVIVIGAGFIGAEFAWAARKAGCTVTVVEVQPVPMAHLLGPEVGAALAALHAEYGTHLMTGTAVDHLEADADGHVSGVVLRDGRRLEAQLVVVGIGTRPATEWLESSGLPVADGVECDADLRVVGYEDIYAAGDVAAWPHPLYGRRMRIEHWTNANEHAATVAAGIVGKPAPAPHPPYVWSDQYGHRIQIIGLPASGSLFATFGTVDEHLLAVYAGVDGAVVGGVVVDDPRTMMAIRKAIVRRVPAADVVASLRPAPAV
jgi:NADPH-dependent 2,4-dienoyl-CoA reductase/sulfur reductase-like enzyme